MALPTHGDGDVSTALWWRIDPELSYSDWTIAVRREEGEGQEGTAADADEKAEAAGAASGGTPAALSSFKEYYVHRAALAFGPNRCGYFGTLFRQGGGNSFKESRNNKIVLDLPSFAFDVFDGFLDFVYGGVEAASLIRTESAVPLLYLADRLDSPSLTKAVLDYARDDVERSFSAISEDSDPDELKRFLAKIALYCRNSRAMLSNSHAEFYALLVRSAQYCAYLSEGDCFNEPFDTLLQETNVDFWIAVLTGESFPRPLNWSEDTATKFKPWIVVAICWRFLNELTISQFEALTSDEVLEGGSRLDLWHVINLLEIEEELSAKKRKRNNNKRKKADGASSEFQELAVRVIAREWRIGSFPEDSAFVAKRPKLSARVIDWLVSAQKKEK